MCNASIFHILLFGSGQLFKGAVSLKTKAYVAIHYSIGLALSIVRRPLKIIFIKGTVSKLHINFSAFTAHLTFESARTILVAGQSLKRKLSNNV